jgi:GR25 family glycosyltransferase involved in LPS biosynthesis
MEQLHKIEGAPYPAFCINMKGADVRRQHCAAQFDKAGIEVAFVRGFDGRASHLRHESHWISNQVGVCISHISVVEEIRHRGLGICLVFEDDIILGADFIPRLQNAMESLPADWDIACLSWFRGKSKPVVEPVSAAWGALVYGDIWGCACYLVNGTRGAEAVYDCLVPIRSHIDRMFWECCRDGYLKGYFITDQFVKQSWEFPSQNI